MRSLLHRSLIRLLFATAVLAACVATPAGPTSPVEGIVTDVDAPTLDRVDSFSMRLDSGAELTFVVAPGDPDVTAADLREHRNFAFRLRVFFSRDAAGNLLAEQAEHSEGD